MLPRGHAVVKMVSEHNISMSQRFPHMSSSALDLFLGVVTAWLS
jgi:hypothetical protein